MPEHCGILDNARAFELAKEGARGDPACQQRQLCQEAEHHQDDCHLLSKEQRVFPLRLRTGHNWRNADMTRTFQLAPPPTCCCGPRRPDSGTHLTALPTPPGGATRVDSCSSSDDQAVWLQRGAGRDDSIHRQSWDDCVAANAKKKKKKKIAKELIAGVLKKDLKKTQTIKTVLILAIRALAASDTFLFLAPGTAGFPFIPRDVWNWMLALPSPRSD